MTQYCFFDCYSIDKDNNDDDDDDDDNNNNNNLV
jgi:hypothetical protein